METPMQKLKRMVDSMIQNGGDYDLLCVVGLIDDTFLNEEKKLIIEAYDSGLELECKSGEDFYLQKQRLIKTP